MLENKERVSFLHVLILLTTLFVFAQIWFAGIGFYVSGIWGVTSNLLNSQIFFSKIFIFPILQLFLSQLIIYSFYIYSLWYVIISIGELFSLRAKTNYFVCILIWLNSVIAILALNTYFATHSFFTYTIRQNLFHNTLTDAGLYRILVMSAMIWLGAILFALINMGINLYRRKNLFRNGLMLTFVFTLFLFSKGIISFATQQVNNVATAEKPNIFIIGFDALRPDFLHYFNQKKIGTPNFDAFLNSSIVFNEAYTPLARTLPSWASILTSRYPLHNFIRDNNADLSEASLQETLPKLLQKAGYETIYATDDRRFNNIDERVGFDHIVGPSDTLAEVVIGTLNDFPLSNLIVSTPMGKWLFPYNYANHAASYAYDPDNFLDLLSDKLKRTSNKPLFLAAHFDLSGWPFTWFNDKLSYNQDELAAYSNAVVGDDRFLGKFLDLLAQNKLLDHAIVVLLSDHGITLELHGDRIISEKLFHGNTTDMKVRRTPYYDKEKSLSGVDSVTQLRSVLDAKHYGIDTSFGYGTDVLSLKQYHALLAVKGYGIALGSAHRVSGRSSLLDIAPTLLDILHLSALKQSEGISLKPFLFDSQKYLNNARPFYFESGYSDINIEQANIVVAKVVADSLPFYRLNLTSGLMTLNPNYIKILIENKQRAVLQGDWLMAYYPESGRYRFVPERQANKKISWKLIKYFMPPYSVLVNIKTGQWTTEMENSFVLSSPSDKLKANIFHFYGDEMKNYH